MYILRSRRRNFKRKMTLLLPATSIAPCNTCWFGDLFDLRAVKDAPICHVAGTCRINDRYLTQINVTLLKIVFGKVIEINT